MLVSCSNARSQEQTMPVSIPLLFWFQVSMNNLVAMAVFDGTHDLLEKASRLVF